MGRFLPLHLPAGPLACSSTPYITEAGWPLSNLTRSLCVIMLDHTSISVNGGDGEQSDPCVWGWGTFGGMTGWLVILGEAVRNEGGCVGLETPWFLYIASPDPLLPLGMTVPSSLLLSCTLCVVGGRTGLFDTTSHHKLLENNSSRLTGWPGRSCKLLLDFWIRGHQRILIYSLRLGVHLEVCIWLANPF